MSRFETARAVALFASLWCVACCVMLARAGITHISGVSGHVLVFAVTAPLSWWKD